MNFLSVDGLHDQKEVTQRSLPAPGERKLAMQPLRTLSLSGLVADNNDRRANRRTMIAPRAIGDLSRHRGDI
jgi:hypothetical protein